MPLLQITVKNDDSYIGTDLLNFGNFREGSIFAKAYAKFREIKILAKWRNHSVDG